MTSPEIEPANGAESILMGLGKAGVEYLFANAGTDFPPIIEALAALDPDVVPHAVTVPHETAGVAMAHGHYLVTGRPQAVMVHVNVGLANAVMGVINAASDNIPMLVMSGRTPITERGRPGSRVTPIQYGQEMFDQASLVRDVVKYTYEMRYPEQGAALVSRAMAIAKTAPEGPVYLSLPREPLAADIPQGVDRGLAQQPAATAPQPDPDAIERLAGWLSRARTPLILCQRGDVNGRLAAAVSEFANQHGIQVCEPFSVRNLLSSDDPVSAGYDPKAAIAKADLIIVLDSDVPWIEALHRPDKATRIAHVGPDPIFARMPVRGYAGDLAIQSDPLAAIKALDRVSRPGPEAEHRRTALATASRDRTRAAEAQSRGGSGRLMTAEWMSRCVSDVMDGDAVAFSELGLLPGFMRLAGPNRLFSNVHAGGLGWAMPAALGAQLADRDRLVIACMGDGSYMFANPVACHQIAEALDLPILTIIKNNGMWNAVRRSVVKGYPDGAAARANTMPLTSLAPSPDYTQVAAASRAYVERVETGADLPNALARAIAVIRNERRQVLLDLRIAVSDDH